MENVNQEFAIIQIKFTIKKIANVNAENVLNVHVDRNGMRKIVLAAQIQTQYVDQICTYGMENQNVIVFAKLNQNANVILNLETQHVHAHLTQNAQVIKSPMSKHAVVDVL
jgi:hypothetical protein